MPDPKDLTPEFFGGETDQLDEEDLAALDRGDSGEAADPTPEPAPEPVAEAPAEEQEAAEAPAEEAAEEADSETALAEPEKAEEAPQKEPAIPKSRFDQVNQARKDAEARLAQLEAQLKGEKSATEQAAKQEYDFDDAEARYMEAVLDGKTEEAKQIRREIRAAERASYESLAVEKASQITAATKAQAEIDVVIAKAEATYPELDPSNEGVYNAAIVEEIGAYYAARMNLGDTPAAAMQKAIDAMVRVHGIGTPPLEPPKPVPAKKNLEVVKKATAAKVELAKKAAPALGDVGKSGAENGLADIDIDKLTDKDIDALPASTLARLRGDFLAA
ncbi:MAG: hypothetical protein VKI63_02575 [Cyanobium sp.]|nr:hypothetical protein [Cyanobium sp.]